MLTSVRKTSDGNSTAERHHILYYSHVFFSQVLLLPSPLARKRLWNPKYPICLQLGKGPTKEEAGAGAGAGVEEPPVEEAEPRPASDLPTTLYLFGRTGREKEEWFHHFSSASMVTQKETPGRCAVRSGTAGERKCVYVYVHVCACVPVLRMRIQSSLARFLLCYSVRVSLETPSCR